VPGRHGPDTLCRRNPGEEQGAAEVERESQGKTGDNAKRAAPGAERIEFAEEQRDHQRSLEGADTAARLVNADHSGANLDHAAMLNRRNPEKAQQFNGGRGIEPQQRLGQEMLQSRRPRHRDEEEAEWEGERPRRWKMEDGRWAADLWLLTSDLCHLTMDQVHGEKGQGDDFKSPEEAG
jgi:hypothetical protein